MLESSEPQLLLHGMRLDLAIEPGASIRQITVHVGGLTSTSSCIFLYLLFLVVKHCGIQACNAHSGTQGVTLMSIVNLSHYLLLLNCVE